MYLCVSHGIQLDFVPFLLSSKGVAGVSAEACSLLPGWFLLWQFFYNKVKGKTMKHIPDFQSLASSDLVLQGMKRRHRHRSKEMPP